MEVQHMLPLHSSGSSYAYYAKDSLVPLQKVAWNHAWSDWLQHTPPPPVLLSDEGCAAFEMQMQHLRFPTPPITPPRGNGLGLGSNFTAAVADTLPHTHTRTQSVIMKVGQGGQSPRQHVATQLTALEAIKLPLSSLEAGSSGSDSSSPSSDYICEWLDCGRYFDSLESLATHVTQIHAVASLTDGLYYCRWRGCPRTERGFNARYKMLVHVRTHTKEKPHQCQLCEKSFSRAENLKIHIRSHSGEKPYVCTYEGCHKAYSNSSDRFKHTRTHSMEKPYMCKVPGCHKRYTDPSSLRKHVKTFKHAMQMLSSAPMYVPALASDAPVRQCVNLSAPSPNSSPVDSRAYTGREAQPPSNTYYCLPPVHNGTYYLNIGPEEMCHFKASQLDLECYYAGTKGPTNVASYWYDSGAGATRSASPLPLHKHDFAMELDVDVDGDGGDQHEIGAGAGETPLDLRVKRS